MDTLDGGYPADYIYKNTGITLRVSSSVNRDSQRKQHVVRRAEEGTQRGDLLREAHHPEAAHTIIKRGPSPPGIAARLTKLQHDPYTTPTSPPVSRPVMLFLKSTACRKQSQFLNGGVS